MKHFGIKQTRYCRYNEYVEFDFDEAMLMELNEHLHNYNATIDNQPLEPLTIEDVFAIVYHQYPTKRITFQGPWNSKPFTEYLDSFVWDYIHEICYDLDYETEYIECDDYNFDFDDEISED